MRVSKPIWMRKGERTQKALKDFMSETSRTIKAQSKSLIMTEH